MAKLKIDYSKMDSVGLDFLKYDACTKLGIQHDHNPLIQHVPN